jgi:DNA-binding GntR family transcriptional regulator
MILQGELLPGQKVHQGDLADKLETSRIPVREALSTLQAEGLLVHRPNMGYSVVRFSREELYEIYLMRRLLETELLRSIDLTQVDTDALVELDAQLSAISAEERLDDYHQINTAFHFALFDHSPFKLVVKQVEQLWYKSAFYRSLYFDGAAAPQVHDDHQAIVAAVRDNDVEALIRISDDHRTVTENLMSRRVGGSRPR